MVAAFLVEGGMEKKIVQCICPGSPVRQIELNGRDASLAAIAKRIGTLFRLFGNRYFPVFIILDREDREISASDMESSLRDLLAGELVPGDQVIFGIPDRMIENWILADPRCIGENCVFGNNEGLNGKSRLRDELEKHNRGYSETADGVELFCKISPVVAASNSESFRVFAQRISSFCVWARAS